MVTKRFESKLQKTDQPSPIAPGEPSSIAMAVLRHAKEASNKPAFCELTTDGQQWFSWGQIANWIHDACQAIDRAIKEANLTRGAHFATVEKNSVEWFVLDFACQIFGCVHVAIDPRWPDAMVASLLKQSDSRLVYSPGRSLNHASELEWQVDRKSPAIPSSHLEVLFKRAQTISNLAPAQMLFTSGTSGEPKGVLLSNRNLLSNALAKLDAAPQFEHDLRLNILPFCHAYARTCELSTWVLSKSRLAISNDWHHFLSHARRLQPTLINLVPHLANKLLYSENSNQKLAPSEIAARLGGRVRLLQVGGAAISDALWYDLEKAGLPPLQGYGLTEASPVVCSNRSGSQRPGTIGPPVDGVELQVDAQGQLWVRGDGVMEGYYDDVAGTQARIQNGWLATGDLVELDPSGHYRLLGRLSETIVLSTGFKASPELIEGRLAKLQCIEQVLVVGQDQPYVVALLWPAWTELPRTFFCDNSCDPHSMNLSEFYQLLATSVRQCLADLPDFMHPRKYIVVLDSIEGTQLVNPKGNLRRKSTTNHFRTDIQAAYSQETPIFTTADRTTG